MSQKACVKSFLQSGRRLTQLEASERWGCSRLASRINDLKSEMNIDSVWVKVVNRGGELVRVKEYFQA